MADDPIDDTLTKEETLLVVIAQRHDEVLTWMREHVENPMVQSLSDSVEHAITEYIRLQGSPRLQELVRRRMESELERTKN